MQIRDHASVEIKVKKSPCDGEVHFSVSEKESSGTIYVFLLVTLGHLSVFDT